MQGAAGFDSCFRMLILDAILETDQAGRIRSACGDQLEGWCNILGGGEWWFGADRKNGGGEKFSDSGHILKVEPRGFPADLNVYTRKRKESRMTPKFLV